MHFYFAKMWKYAFSRLDCCSKDRSCSACFTHVITNLSETISFFWYRTLLLLFLFEVVMVITWLMTGRKLKCEMAHHQARGSLIFHIKWKPKCIYIFWLYTNDTYITIEWMLFAVEISHGSIAFSPLYTRMSQIWTLHCFFFFLIYFLQTSCFTSIDTWICKDFSLVKMI